MRQYVQDAKAKGATVIVCSPVPRNTWADGKIKRGFDGYAQWAADAAKASGAFFLDLNTLAADRYDALGQEQTAKYFFDFQHTTKIGAKTECWRFIVEGLKKVERLHTGQRPCARRSVRTKRGVARSTLLHHPAHG